MDLQAEQPGKLLKIPYGRQYKPWPTKLELREVRRKRRLWKNAKNGINREEYDQAAKKVKNLIRNAKRNQEKKLATERYQNSKPFYSYVKKKTTTKAAVGPLISEQGEVIRDEEEMAEELNKYFSSVFTREEPDQVPVPEPAARPTRSKLKGVWITTEKVRRKSRSSNQTALPARMVSTPVS